MKKRWLWLLAGGLAACNGQVRVAPEVALQHHYDAAFRQQVALLHAKEVTVSVAPPATGGGPTVLKLYLLLPRDQPQRPDTLKQRAHKLAHLLAADLAHPDRYPVLNVQVTERKGYFDKEATSQSFIYPLLSLR